MARKIKESRLTQLQDFLGEIDADGAKFSRQQKISLGRLFLEDVMGFSKDELIACKSGKDLPDFELKTSFWALFITDKDDLRDEYDNRALQYLHSDKVGEEFYSVITNGKELCVFDFKHEVSRYTVNFAALLDGNVKVSKHWQVFLKDFGVESAKERKQKSHAKISIVEKRRVGTGQIYQGDNLEVMRSLEGEKIDLIYIDPPFCAQNVMKSKAWGKKVVSFNDEWGGGINSYIRWLVPRLRECHRLLKDTGVFCLHLDQRSVHYAKVELDKIFGRNCFINEIVWCYRTGGASKKYFAKKHDLILCYAKNHKVFTYNLTKERVYYEKPFFGTKQDDKGRYYTDVLPVDWWTNEKPIINMSKEGLGYPTQKPLTLLEKFIRAFSNKGDFVADFFCGCGTTVSAAQNLNRKWLGCDVSKDAIAVIRKRMIKEHELKVDVVRVGALSRKEIYKLNPFEFEKKMVELIGGTPNIRQVGDRGIDGRMHDSTPIQVKQKDNIGRPVIDSFYRHVKSGNGKGIIIAKSFAKTAYEEVDRLFNEEGLQIDLVPSDDIIRDAA